MEWSNVIDFTLRAAARAIVAELGPSAGDQIAAFIDRRPSLPADARDRLRAVVAEMARVRA